MKLVHPDIDYQFKLDGRDLNTLVIENQRFFYEFLKDLHAQLDGQAGQVALSEHNECLKMSGSLEIISEFIDFDINKRTLLSRLYSKLEAHAMESEQYEDTMQLLQSTESYLMSLVQDVPGEVVLDKLNVGALIKAVGLRFENEYADPLEKIYDYMDLLRQLDGEKVFVLVNMRSYFDDEQICRFYDTALHHQFCFLPVESSSHTLLPSEHRVMIDSDLCEIWQGIDLTS